MWRLIFLSGNPSSARSEVMVNTLLHFHYLPLQKKLGTKRMRRNALRGKYQMERKAQKQMYLWTQQSGLILQHFIEFL